MNHANAPTFRKLPLLLCLVFLAPGVSLAAEKGFAEHERLDGKDEFPPLSWVEEPQEDDAIRAFRLALRLPAEVGGGLSMSAMLGIAAGFSGWAGCELLTFRSTRSAHCINDVGLPVFAGGALLGMSLGVWWAGQSMDGNGSFLATFLGSGAGLLLGAGAALLTEPETAMLVLPIFSVAGGIIGYEISQRPERTRVQPTLALSSRGAWMGLGGSF